MKNRANYFGLAPKGMEILMEQEKFLARQFKQEGGVSLTIWELVKLRVSQINQCAFCIDMHTKDALAAGEDPARLYGLNAWKDTPFYTDDERLALKIAETLTAAQPILDDLYTQGEETFGEQGLVELTLAVNAINSWNRMSKMFLPKVGTYQPGQFD